MNLEILYTLRERLKNILITGTSLLSEDFRLKKAVEEMALLAKVAPVFAQIDAMAKALLQSERDAGRYSKGGRTQGNRKFCSSKGREKFLQNA